MVTRALTATAALLLALLTGFPASAATVWDEDPAANDDLSGDRNSPTQVTFVPGQNDIVGQTGKGDTGTDRDYFTFVIPHGYVLDALIVLNADLAPLSNAAFIGLESGAKVTVDPAAPDAALLLGYHHFSGSDEGHDILAAMGAKVDAQGFTPPLGEGTYSVWIQDTNLGASLYTLQFDVVLVPGPETLLLVLTGLAGLAGMRPAGSRIGRRRPASRGDR